MSTNANASGEAVCELCASVGGELLWQDETCRVVRVDDPHYPGFCRVILNRHAAEMSDLPAHERRHVMDVVFAVEFALRELLQPDKINLASFGNMVPHVHWHVIPRWQDDRHFPQPTWGPVQRVGTARAAPDSAALRGQIIAALTREQSGAL